MIRLVRALVLPLVLASACTPELPDPGSAGAAAYRASCGSCHVAYAPGSLTAAMWEMQVDRMQQEIARRGLPPLTAQQRELVLRYLRAHATDAAAARSAAAE